MSPTPNPPANHPTGDQPQHTQRATTPITNPRKNTEPERVRFVLTGFIAGAATIGMAWSISTRNHTTHATATAAPTPFPATTIDPRQRPALTTDTPADLDQPTTSRTTTPTIGIIDINTADRETLDLLPGIGPALAERIASDRNANGPYESIEDLQRVHGIGPRIINNIRHLVTVTAPESPADQQNTQDL